MTTIFNNQNWISSFLSDTDVEYQVSYKSGGKHWKIFDQARTDSFLVSEQFPENSGFEQIHWSQRYILSAIGDLGTNEEPQSFL